MAETNSQETQSVLPDNIGKLQPLILTVARPIVRYLWDIQVEGLENVPDDGPAVLCPNHISVFDSFVLPAVLPRGITYVGKAEYLDDWKTAKLFPAMGMIPIDRRGGEHARSALGAARAVLERGGLFGIYPEGTRSRSGKLHRGHTGAARLAVETGAPILPIGLVGTLGIQPPSQALPNVFRRATVRIGSPVDVARYQHRIGDRDLYREIIDEVMYEIQALSGQEYDDTYATSKKPAPAVVDLRTSDPSSAAAPSNGRTPQPESEATIPRRSSASVLQPEPLLV